MKEFEEKILGELETTSIHIMRPNIKNYIENNVNLYREGMKQKMKKIKGQMGKLSSNINR